MIRFHLNKVKNSEEEGTGRGVMETEAGKGFQEFNNSRFLGWNGGHLGVTFVTVCIL